MQAAPFKLNFPHATMCEPMPSPKPEVLPSVRYSGPSMDTFWRDSMTFIGQSHMVIVGHRGCGKNKIAPVGVASEPRPSIKENSIMSFNLAAKNGAAFVEFDVQVTMDGHPVIFHDDIILTEEEGQIVSRSIPELTLEEFLSIGPQKDANNVGRKLSRKTVDGSICNWTVSLDDSLCTLREAFQQVPPTVGFNIEIKFDNTIQVLESELRRTIAAILLDAKDYGMGRKICFSSFHPDAVEILRREQSVYPVYFLTDGGIHVYSDPRRNSIEAAIDVCRKSGLQGIVSEVRAILSNPAFVPLIKKENLSLLTYGELNNMVEAFNKQVQIGVDGVIVDHVLEMATVARNLYQPAISPTSHSRSVILKAAA